ncbi:molybdopterin molybdotransferase MoeA [Sphingosinicella terrae]|uniref:molybdopterin molybdotransferase MoeA n=1 Tax=Sphingosinicella terrae TaxID=2172047 RepID=UPI000E0DCEAD|nr:molybdopterin molybdotransferase MoeA [Sphingosinicella terrae]
MITFDEATALVGRAASPLAVETVPIERAQGRVLARSVEARVDSPPCNVSAMDGYALRDADLAELPARLRVVGQSFPGDGFVGTLGKGECIRIFTGGPVPPGVDRVVIQENVERDGDIALIGQGPGEARHIRRAGSDFRAGAVLLEPGRRLDARALVAAAGADHGEIEVWRRPRLIVLGTGDELVEPGRARSTPAAIPESVSYGVAALAEAWGANTVGRRRLRDDLAAMSEAAAEAVAAADLVVVTGGASVGDKDFAKPMFGEPLDLIFSKVAIKPGKPVWLGRLGTTLVMGLPGNPTSALVTARLLLAPLLAGQTGRDPAEALRWRSARLAAALGPCGDRETFVRARREDDAAIPLGNQDSGAQHSLAAADWLIRRRAGAPAAGAGEIVEVLDF